MSQGTAERTALPLGLLGAAAFLSSAGARVVDPLLHAIATDFGVGVPDLWIVIAAFTLPYGLSQLLLGPVGDRFGKLRVMLAALAGYALFTGACALASDLAGLCGAAGLRRGGERRADPGRHGLYRRRRALRTAPGDAEQVPDRHRAWPRPWPGRWAASSASISAGAACSWCWRLLAVILVTVAFGAAHPRVAGPP